MKTTTPKGNLRLAYRKSSRSDVGVECRRGSLGLGKNLAVKFLDVSEGGVRVTVKEQLAPGDEIEVILIGCHAGKPVKRLSKVCWAVPMENSGYCVGLQFEKRLLHMEVLRISKP